MQETKPAVIPTDKPESKTKAKIDEEIDIKQKGNEGEELSILDKIKLEQ
jgi:hypothetical protein